MELGEQMRRNLTLPFQPISKNLCLRFLAGEGLPTAGRFQQLFFFNPTVLSPGPLPMRFSKEVSLAF
jgi:hypothetical protein